MKRQNNVHHIRPRSRTKEGVDPNVNNLTSLPIHWHEAWHFLFGNMTVEEVHRYIELVMRPGTVWSRKSLVRLAEKLKSEGVWK